MFIIDLNNGDIDAHIKKKKITNTKAINQTKVTFQLKMDMPNSQRYSLNIYRINAVEDKNAQPTLKEIPQLENKN